MVRVCGLCFWCKFRVHVHAPPPVGRVSGGIIVDDTETDLVPLPTAGPHTGCRIQQRLLIECTGAKPFTCNGN